MLQPLESILVRLKPRRASDILLWGIVAFLVIFIIWASLTELDRTIRANGRVVPSSQLQVVSNLEGGIVEDIFVKSGDSVRKGQKLLGLDPIQSGAELASGEFSLSSLRARIGRLRAEVYGRPPVFSELTGGENNLQVRAERALYDARASERRSRGLAMQARVNQARSAIAEAQDNYRARIQARDGKNAELATIRRLVDLGVEPRFNLQRAESAASIASSEASLAAGSITRAQGSLSEAIASLSQFRQEWRAQAASELALSEAELDMKRELSPALEDRLERTIIRTPVQGRVNRVLVTTLGGTIGPGQPLVEIVPSEEDLIIEAKVKPKDIATVKIGQKAQVAITAFDRSVYGALPGEVIAITPDAIVNEESGEAFYTIRVQTKAKELDNLRMRSIRISPGMIAEVDLLGEKRTILQYLLTPFNKIKEGALRE